MKSLLVTSCFIKSGTSQSFKPSVLRKILSLPNTKFKTGRFKFNFSDTSCKSDVGTCLEEFSDVLDEIVSPLFKRNLKSNNSYYTDSTTGFSGK